MHIKYSNVMIVRQSGAEFNSNLGIVMFAAGFTKSVCGLGDKRFIIEKLATCALLPKT